MWVQTSGPWLPEQDQRGVIEGGHQEEKCVCVTSVRTSGCDISSRLTVTSLGQQCEGSPSTAGVHDVNGSVGGATVCV